MRLIAEVKHRSPSGGTFLQDYRPEKLASIYQDSGAAAVSVLTEGPHFGGDFKHIRDVRSVVDLPILCKDFITDPYHICQAAAAGADAVLLISELLEVEELILLIETARTLRLAALVESHSSDSLERAVASGAQIIGINNRDLSMSGMPTDIETTLRLRDRVPEDRILVTESGIHGRKDVVRLEEAGIDAMLVGTSILKAEDPGEHIAMLLGMGS